LNSSPSVCRTAVAVTAVVAVRKDTAVSDAMAASRTVALITSKAFAVDAVVSDDSVAFEQQLDCLQGKML
jgi:hypothetical protein